MPLTTRYLTATPHDVVRHILICQIAVAFITCFLTIISIHSSLYRVASSPLTTRRQLTAVAPLDESPCVIVTATDNPIILKSFFSTMSMDIQQRPSIIAYTSNISNGDRDDMQHIMKKDDLIVMRQEKQYVDHFYRLIDQLITNNPNNNFIVWIDPSSSIVSGYLIHHLSSIIHEHDGYWSICQSETVCTILGVDTRNQTIRGMIHDMTFMLS